MNFPFSSRDEFAVGFVPPSIFLSQYKFAFMFPIVSKVLMLKLLQESRLSDLTLEMWEPRFLWIPEHSMQTSIPRLMEAQSGFSLPQSAQCVFPGMLCLTWSMFITSFLQREFRISLWIAFSHSTTSSWEQSWNCHCVLSRDTNTNSFAEDSLWLERRFLLSCCECDPFSHVSSSGSRQSSRVKSSLSHSSPEVDPSLEVFSPAGFFAWYFHRHTAKLDFFPINIVNISLEGRVVSHYAVTAEGHVFPLVQPRCSTFFIHVALLQWDQPTPSCDFT